MSVSEMSGVGSKIGRAYRAIARATAIGTKADKVLFGIERTATRALPISVITSAVVDKLHGTGAYSIGPVYGSIVLAAFLAAELHSERHGEGLKSGEIHSGFHALTSDAASARAQRKLRDQSPYFDGPSRLPMGPFAITSEANRPGKLRELWNVGSWYVRPVIDAFRHLIGRK